MKKIYTTIIACAIVFSAQGAVTVTALPEGAVTDMNVEKSASSLLVKMKVNPKVFARKANREVWLTPAIATLSDTLWLQPVVVAGRTRYYQHLRDEKSLQGATMLHSGSDDSFEYKVDVPYQEWMDYSTLVLKGRVDGCCGDALAQTETEPLYALDFRDKTLHATYVYKSPTKEIVKTRSVSGQAYIDFPVNKMEIYPDYRRNPAELLEIQRTIDEVRNDKDVTITSLSFKGYASPEGPYENNERLAKGRTEALIGYVGKLYSFPKNVMHSSWEAEDWEGLEKRLHTLNIENKDKIMELVANQQMLPDEKDAMLKKQFPKQYEYLLTNVYPALRHSDYKVEYQVRNFTDVKEIAELMNTAPQKLSLDELFLYARSLDKNSPEFREVMEVAVRMFPDNEEANLNAATTAVSNGEYDKARAYLSKAGDSAEAHYTAGVLEANLGNYPEAKRHLEEASRQGISEAKELLDQMKSFGMTE